MTREEAIQFIAQSVKSDVDMALIVDALKTLEQEPRKGRLIETKEISTNRRGQIVHEVICSECGGIAYFRSMGNKYIGANLCRNCGAKMEEEVEK